MSRHPEQAPRLSVIIPTYNEAQELPGLLASLGGQTRRAHEIIVADAQSTDDTPTIARTLGCRVVSGGLPAVGRNAGAAVASGDYFLFLDADVVVPPDFLEKITAEFDARYLELATVVPRPRSSVRIDHLFFSVNALLMEGMQQYYPVTFGATMLMTRRLFRRVGGFNPALTVDEDNHFGNRAKKLAKFGVLTSTHIALSVRRFETEGRLRLMQKYVQQGVFRHLKAFGVERSIEYQFGQFAQQGNLTGAEQFLEDLLTQLERFQIETEKQTKKVRELFQV